MSEAEFRDWMHRLTKRYPGISGVCVTGSRVLNTGKRPRARWALWEVVAFLEEGRCYEEVPTDAVLRCRYRVIDDTAARIAADPDLRSPDIDLYFMLGLYCAAVNWNDAESLAQEFVEADAFGDSDGPRLCRKFTSAMITWDRKFGE
ncbi:MAG: hypothetical protein KBI47_01810 [Armatimonadetes bacterium]|nr:hypothetical protein [Armatimonadota bacterium]